MDSEARDVWSRKELSATVDKYIETRNRELQGITFVKKAIYEDLSKKIGRSSKSVEYRMQNISYVFAVMGRQWITGLKPAKNVGSNVLKAIAELIEENEGYFSVDQIEFEAQVSKLRRKKRLESPPGSVTPNKQVSKATAYSRDAEVTAWVLKESDGICESCASPAPFTKPDGDSYLEVHHVKRLADGGSDTISNAVAVCPNCHRALHYSANKDKSSMTSRLYGFS